MYLHLLIRIFHPNGPRIRDNLAEYQKLNPYIHRSLQRALLYIVGCNHRTQNVTDRCVAFQMPEISLYFAFPNYIPSRMTALDHPLSGKFPSKPGLLWSRQRNGWHTLTPCRISNRKCPKTASRCSGSTAGTSTPPQILRRIWLRHSRRETRSRVRLGVRLRLGRQTDDRHMNGFRGHQYSFFVTQI